MKIEDQIIAALKRSGAYNDFMANIAKDGGNPNHDESGMFSSGDGGASSSWIKSGAASGVLAAAVSKLGDPATAKAALAIAINSALSSIGKMDQGNLQDAAVRAEIENFAANAQVAAGRAKEIISQSVKALIGVMGGKMDKAESISIATSLARLSAVLDRIEVDVAKDSAGNPNHEEKGQFSSGDGGGGGRERDDADNEFLAEHGKEYEAVMDEAFDDHSIRADTLSEIMSENPGMSPDQVSQFLRDNYLDHYDDEDDIAKEYLEREGISPLIAAHVDLSSLSTSLTADDGPYQSFYNDTEELYFVFERPEKV